MKSLNIFIIGGGVIGRSLIEALVKEGNNITLIDTNETIIRDFSSQYDILTCVGNGASYHVLVENGIEEADLLIAVTDSDELNLLCATVASQVSSCNTVARIRNPEYSREVWYLRDKLGLSLVINPELESAIEISRILNYPAALEVNSFSGGGAEMISFKIGEESPLCYKKLSDFMKSIKANMLFTVAERNGETFIPKGDYEFVPGDIVSYVTRRRKTIESLRALGLYKNPLKSCLIVGGGKGAFYVAEYLLKAGLEVKIIEEDYKRCEQLSGMLPKAKVVNGDGSDPDVLLEEGIEYFDAVIPYTDIDEVNIMLTLTIRKISNAKIITKIGSSKFKSTLDDLGLESMVIPRRLATDQILAYTRAKRFAGDNEIETLYRMFDDKVEAIEFLVTKESKLTGIPLSDLKLVDNVLIAFIFRKGKIVFPKGSDCILPGDSVMVVTTNSGYTNVLDILK